MHDVYLIDVEGVDALKSLVASKVRFVGLQEAPYAQCAKNDWFSKAVSDKMILPSVDALGEKTSPIEDLEKVSHVADLERGSPTSGSSNDDDSVTGTPSVVTVSSQPQNITKAEVLLAQEAWGSAIKRISRAHRDGEDYVQAASDAAANLYAYNQGNVMFKPTKAAVNAFRPTGEAALSYFVGGTAVKNGYAEDTGFAINEGKGWSEVEFDNHQIDLDGHTGMAMGNYYFTCASTGTKVKVEYTFGYKKGADDHVRIFLHHSSVPYSKPNSKPKPPPSPPRPSPPSDMEALWLKATGGRGDGEAYPVMQ
jgi:hypothetical protein